MSDKIYKCCDSCGHYDELKACVNLESDFHGPGIGHTIEINKEEAKKYWPDNMGTTFAEFGTSQKVSFANVTMIDTEGKKHEIPRCEKCGNYKQLVAGKEAFTWICDCDYTIMHITVKK